MIQNRTCRQCGAAFQGGPAAYYCPTCRRERQLQQGREHKRRKRMGLTRNLGDIDRCAHCGREYAVTGGNQKYCPQCGPALLAERDRKMSIAYYHKHKSTINPIRYERRKVGPVTCRECGKEFDPQGTRRLYCSKKCRRKSVNREWLKRYYIRKPTAK